MTKSEVKDLLYGVLQKAKDNKLFGGNVEISKETGNAIEEKTDGFYVGKPSNKTTLDKLSESSDGNLLYDGNEIKGGSDIKISADDGNAIVKGSDEGIFTREVAISPDMPTGEHKPLFWYDTSEDDTTDYVSSYEYYGVRVCKPEGSPFARVEYFGKNTHFISAGMNYDDDVFDYGDWKDAWFIKDIKVVQLGYDGTVKKELNPNDLTKDIDGNAFDPSDSNMDGNIMVGIPTVWVKREQRGIWQYYYFAKSQLDENYHAYAHTNWKGEIIPYAYMSAFEGSYINSKCRSLSGQRPGTSQTFETENTYCNANNLDADNPIWSMNPFSDIMLIRDLLLLIGKSTNTKAVYGTGHNSGGSQASHLYTTGLLNNKGLFYGTQGNDSIKVFGLENFYGDRWDRIVGWVSVNGKQKVKCTYGTEDGSTATGYNTTGDGYIPIEGISFSGTSAQYCKDTKLTPYGLIPYSTGASATTYECSGLFYVTNITAVSIVGGCCHDTLLVPGSNFINAGSLSNWAVGGSSSCKPLN